VAGESRWNEKPRTVGGAYPTKEVAEGNERPVVVPVVVDIVEVELAVGTIADEVRRVEVVGLRVAPEAALPNVRCAVRATAPRPLRLDPSLSWA